MTCDLTHRPGALLDVIESRWSPRAFADQPVDSTQLRALLEAARWAPSCFGEEPWRFIVGTLPDGKSTHDKLVEILVPQNAVWAAKAPLLMLSVAKLHFTFDGSPNRHAQHDVGLAVENLVLQAQALGLYSHQMGGFSVDKAHDLFGIPRGLYEPMAVIAIGHLASPDTLPNDAMRQREVAPRTRKPLSEIAFTRYWEGSPPV